MKKFKRKNRKKISKLKVFLLVIVLLAIVWAFNTFTLTVKNIEIKSDKIKKPVKIVHITDLHGAKFGIDNSKLIKKINKLEPDFVAITGDMYTNKDEKGKETAIKFMTTLAQDNVVYFVNGEHDYHYSRDTNNDYFERLKESGVKVMDYKYENIKVNGNNICLYGITNVNYTSTFDLANEFTLDKSKFNLLLAHIENFEKFAHFGIDLSLCGDTHGGQVYIPFVGALYNNGVWLPETNINKNGQYVKGLYKLDDSQLFVSSGLGNYPVPVRFCNFPEIVQINLVGTN